MDTERITGQDDAPVIACELGGDETSAQVKRWMRLGRDAGLERVETEDGLRIRFRDEPTVGEELRALVAVESSCCSWALWEVGRADGDLILTVSSTPEGAATLHTMFSTGTAWARRGTPSPPATLMTLLRVGHALLPVNNWWDLARAGHGSDSMHLVTSGANSPVGI